MTLKVIGAGFGRTGTLSLKMALEMLGLGRCYHMAEVFQNPGHSELWSAAADGNVDWEKLLEGYSCAVDWPSTYFWRELANHYPEGKNPPDAPVDGLVGQEWAGEDVRRDTRRCSRRQSDIGGAKENGQKTRHRRHVWRKRRRYCPCFGRL